MRAVAGTAKNLNHCSAWIILRERLSSIWLIVFLVFLFHWLGAPAAAQNYLTLTGTPTFSAPEPAEYGFVETANGNLHLEFPLGAFPERGSKQPYTLKLLYDSHVWQIGSSGSGSTWVQTPTNNLLERGWTFTAANAGILLEADYGWQVCGADFSWTDSSASTHFFPLPSVETVNSAANQCPFTANAFATDSSGFHLYYNYTGYQISVYAPDGTLVYSNPPVQDSQGNKILVKDANGNYFSQTTDLNTWVVDTLGRIPAKANIVTGMFALTNSQADSSRSNYSITQATISVKTGFGQSGVTEFNGSMTVLQSLTLADGTSFSFKYDCDSALNSQACGSPHGQTAYYGVLTSITTPTGGQLTYGYTNFSDSSGNKSRWLTSRRGAGSGYWTYTPQVISTCSSSQFGFSCQEKLTVQKPSGDKTIYTFTLDNGAWPTQIQQYNAQNNLMSTTTNTWDFSVACALHGCHGHGYIRKSSEITTIPTSGGSNLTKKTAYSYDSPQQGNVTAIQEWKFYPGTSPTFPSVPDRASYITYFSGGTNIINKPQSTTLCNNSGSDSACLGGGSKVTQTLYTYDAYSSGSCPSALKPMNLMSNHDDTNFGGNVTARGNPTLIRRWVSGATYLGTQLCYDTTGQVYETLDPLLNPTLYDYSDNFFTETGPGSMSTSTPSTSTNAYLKSVTQGGLTSTYGYYYGGGKQAIVTDPNGVTAYDYYWDPFDRHSLTVAPIGWSQTNYTSATQVDNYDPVADTAPSSNCQSCQDNSVSMDSWGRKVNQKLANAPGGAINIDTNYDLNGRVQSVSHPYVSVSDPSHVFETYSYDGLDRQIAVTHPDNQSSQMALGPSVAGFGGATTQQSSPATYGYGYPVLSADEAGKQRQRWIDGFGQVIEVDEPSTSAGTAGSATITMNGSEQSITVDPCAPCEPMGCPACPSTTYDSGTVSVTVNGFTATATYQGSSGNIPNSGSVAASLASALNVSASPVIAVRSGSSITMTAKGPGASTNFSFTTAYTYDTGNFHSHSFWATPASGSLAGGSGGISGSPWVTAYTYDVAGNLKQVFQNLQTRAFTYDGLGRPTSRSTPEAGTEYFYYTVSDGATLCAGSADAICRRIDARNITTTYTYNSRNQIIGKAYSNGQGSVTYQYDQGGAGAFALGRLTSVADSSGSESYTYNSMGWMTQLQKTIGTTTYPILYGYNAGGQVTQITYPSGRIVQQTPDSIGRLQTVASGGTNYLSISSPSGYNSAGQVLSMSYGNGVIANFGYSSSTRDEMTSLSYAKGANTVFNLNYYYQNIPTNCATGAAGNNGQIQCIVDLTPTAVTPGAPGRTISYTYDPLGRLATAVTTGSTQFAKWGIAETYDRYGNRLNQAATAGSPPSNILSFATTPAPPTNPPGGAYTNRPDGYSFDASGNMLNDGLNTLTYDAENCLTSNTNTSTGTTNYTCDAAGVRVKKALQAGTTTVYIFDGDLDIAEYNNGAAPGSPSREFVYAGSDLLASITGTNTIYHHKDHLSVRLYTDANGQVTGQEATYPYGESWYSTSAPDQFVFTTYQRDSESGNDYAMARYYINRFGRFCSADPLMGDPSDPQSWNRYAYVRNDPINMTDPSGQDWLRTLLSVLIPIASAITFQPEGFILGQAIEEAIFQTAAQAMNHYGSESGQKQPQGQQPQGARAPSGYTPCDPKWFIITGVGPHQAPNGATGTPPSNGDVAFNPKNFGLTPKQGRTIADSDKPIVFQPDWASAQITRGPHGSGTMKPAPDRGYPQIPNGLPVGTDDTLPGTDVIGGKGVNRTANENRIDVYRYPTQKQADAATRRVPVTVFIPNGSGAKCPK